MYSAGFAMIYLTLLISEEKKLMDLNLTGEDVYPQLGLFPSAKCLKSGHDRFLWHVAHAHTSSCERTYIRVWARFGGAPETDAEHTATPGQN
jgi:hypothetical protein